MLPAGGIGPLAVYVSHLFSTTWFFFVFLVPSSYFPSFLLPFFSFLLLLLVRPIRLQLRRHPQVATTSAIVKATTTTS